MKHPWLDGRFPRPDSMSESLQIFGFLAANAAAGDVEGVSRDWRALPHEAHTAGVEVVLQTHLFAGFPRIINALAAIGAAGIHTELTADEPRRDWTELGEELCQTIYGRGYPGLRQRMHQLHPVMDRLMVEIGYGRVLSRPGLSPRERELCAVAVLAGLDVLPQLESHLRGSLRVGATPDECSCILAPTGAIWGDAVGERADTVWRKVLGSV